MNKSRIAMLEEAVRAAIKYDEEIERCANDPETMSSHCTAHGDTLDDLYEDWINKSRAALREPLDVDDAQILANVAATLELAGVAPEDAQRIAADSLARTTGRNNG